MKLATLFCSILVIAHMSMAHAASFDCDKASTPIEKTLCQDDSLSEYDEIMAYAYQQLRTLDKSNAAEHKSQQQQWIEKRNYECMDGDADCLLKLYPDRIRDLENAVVGLNSRGKSCDGIYQYQHSASLDGDDTPGQVTDALITSPLDQEHRTFSLGIQGSNGHSCTFRGIARRTAEGFNWSTYLPDVGNGKSPECELDFKTSADKQTVSLTTPRGNDPTDPEYGNACHAYFCGQRAGLPPDGSVFQAAKGQDCESIRNGILDGQEIPD
ncbi:lysozyme inhibitor LprI family protein [Thiothrix subterranea]|uniref:Lysozyme inhibitor LprI family protein n=1 Tax=Thiothrix subterranea TaxID=2735563 RepID=A0AA51MPN6_9GAMM|nr:lysozyme inhibitor LprI family protein [Thiothrix subterranea]MDQ5766926.1 lysozyme inhibitor LprI family protein [Thiothrix subterranea]WML88212.1 lysozyme inhibitor LprI family protein [Thiothrix subterranea]